MTIRTDNGTLESALRMAKDRVERDYVKIQTQGRALSEDEQKRGAALAKCLELIDEALVILKQKNGKYRRQTI